MKKTNWRKLILALALPVMALGFYACDDDDDKDKDLPKMEIKAEGGEFGSSASLTFTKEGGTQTVTINGTREWTVKSGYPEWITVTPVTGNGEKSVSIDIDPNTDPRRTYALEFHLKEYTSFSVTLNISQEGDNNTQTIASVREHFNDGGSPEDGWYIEGVVVSERAGGNIQPFQMAIVDNSVANSGIMVNYKSGEAAHTYNVGDKVGIYLDNATYKNYNGLYQLNDVLASDVTLVSRGNAANPVAITVAQLKTGDYESMLISIADAELADKSNPNATMNGSNGNTTIKVGSDTFIMRLASATTFRDEPAPMGKGTMIGIAGVYNTDFQVMPRVMADVEGMQDADAKVFSVSPNTDQTVSAETETFTFNVTSRNITWTVASDNDEFTYTASVFNESAQIEVTFGKNTSATDTRSAKITFATEDIGIPEADRVIEVTITQSKLIDSSALIYRETWGTFGDGDGVAISTYNKSGTTMRVQADVAGVTYSSNSTYAKVYNTVGGSGTGWVAPSSGYDEASGGSQLLIPKSSRGETITINGIKVYDAAKLQLGIAHRRNAAGDVVVKYTFNTGETGTFAYSSQVETGDNNWYYYVCNAVTVPTGAVSIKLEISAGVDSNIRADDLIINAVE